jgi:hypothetical protein
VKVFISWSGERSRGAAKAMAEWLSCVFAGRVAPWISEHDIGAGSRWGQALSASLEECNFGIICLTPDNLTSPWLLFEAGCLSKTVKSSRVVPYLLQLKPTEIEFPLAQFQAVAADKQGTFKLVESLNVASEGTLSAELLQRAFSKWWPELEAQLRALPSVGEVIQPTRSERALLEESLQLLRGMKDQGKGYEEILRILKGIANQTSPKAVSRSDSSKSDSERMPWSGH